MKRVVFKEDVVPYVCDDFVMTPQSFGLELGYLAVRESRKRNQGLPMLTNKAFQMSWQGYVFRTNAT